ncbi:MAG: hypothetical protein DMD81_00280 [Candidatus Rokuibacteriota bacterium]|nr:MAG: hypothetical protein DMD81_00280 [Candidatus Rokubacteria bacterium]
MPSATHPLEELREKTGIAIRHGTDLIADLKAFSDLFEALIPELTTRTTAERWNEVARLSGIDAAMPDRLEAFVESLSDVLAGLTPSDGGQAWLRRRRAALDAGEDASAA